MSNRYVEDLRRIIGTDELQGGLSSAPVKSSIGGKRGIGFFVDNVANGTTGSPGETLAPTQLKSSTEGGLEANDDGKLINPNDPASGIFSEETGNYTLDPPVCSVSVSEISCVNRL